MCVPNKTEDLNFSMFDMITRINESKTLTKCNKCKFNGKFNGRKCHLDQKWNNEKCQWECTKHHK